MGACSSVHWRPKQEAVVRQQRGCWQIEGMKKNERGNGDVLLCISQVAVILSPWFKVITDTNLFLYISIVSPGSFQLGVAAVKREHSKCCCEHKAFVLHGKLVNQEILNSTNNAKLFFSLNLTCRLKYDRFLKIYKQTYTKTLHLHLHHPSLIS